MLYAYDTDGYLGDVASLFVWSDLCEHFRKSGVPELIEFADAGYTENVERLAEALDSMEYRNCPEDALTLCKHLAGLARVADNVLIVSDGIEDKRTAPQYPALNFEHARPLYVNRRVVNANEIIAWAKSVGFSTALPPEDLHVTVVYSREPFDWMAIPADSQHVYVQAGERELMPLGDKGAIVLRFTSAALQKRWQEFRDAGASWDYDKYQPHITLTYDPPAGLNVAAIKAFPGTIELGPERFEELDTDWSDKIVEHSADEGEPIPPEEQTAAMREFAWTEGCVWRTINGRRVCIKPRAGDREAVEAAVLDEVRDTRDYYEACEKVGEWLEAPPPPLNEESVGTVEEYVRSSSAINSALRKHKGDMAVLEKKLDAEYVEQIKAMDEVMANAPVKPYAVRVSRGMPDHVFENLKKGDVFVDHGFVSTSFNINVANTFHGGAVADIMLPPGTKFLPVPGVAVGVKKRSLGDYDKLFDLGMQEVEAVLPRGTKFRVKGKARDNRLDIDTIYLEVVQ